MQVSSESTFETKIMSLSFYRHFDTVKNGLIACYIKLKLADHGKFKNLICKESPDVISGEN